MYWYLVNSLPEVERTSPSLSIPVGQGLYLISETFAPLVSVVMEVEPKWSPRKYSTLSYAKAHDQTVADDYFQAMQRVEQRLEIVPSKQEENIEDVKVQMVQDSAKLLLWVERLELPELCYEERLEIAGAPKGL
ncbi:MAG TPA: hypothetical protein PKL78_06605 [Anaerolineales bacterium]|nr:hypothetical protein [Anaerolineales bacterium]